MTGRQEAQETQERLFNRKPGKNGKTEPRITRMYADKMYSEDCWLQNAHETQEGFLQEDRGDWKGRIS